MIRKEDIKQYEEELIENFKELHKMPEIGFYEFETSKFIKEKLDEMDISYVEMARTGIVAEIKGTEDGPTFGYRADIDALPIAEKTDLDYKSRNENMMHACGHDGHAAMLLGACRYFSENKDKIKGSIKFIFQPAEEGIPPQYYDELLEEGINSAGGAATMVDGGAVEGIDRMFALHVDPSIPVNEIEISDTRATASSDRYKVEIIGNSSHGSLPELSIDPTAALANIITGYNQLPSREFSALDNVVLSIGNIDGPGTWNQIPGKITLEGTFRTFDNDIREKLAERMEEIAVNIGKAYRCDINFERVKSAGPTINDPEMVSLVKETAHEIFGQDIESMYKPPIMGAEDVGEFMSIVPGALAWVGIKTDEDAYGIHNERFVLDPSTLINGVLLHVNVYENYINSIE